MSQSKYTFLVMPFRFIALLGLFVAVSAVAESKNGFILDDAKRVVILPTLQKKKQKPNPFTLLKM